MGELAERGGERSEGEGGGLLGRQRGKREEPGEMLFVTAGPPEKGREGAGAQEGQRWGEAGQREPALGCRGRGGLRKGEGGGVESESEPEREEVF